MINPLITSNLRTRLVEITPVLGTYINIGKRMRRLRRGTLVEADELLEFGVVVQAIEI
jgi:hypothetical protein